MLLVVRIVEMLLMLLATLGCWLGEGVMKEVGMESVVVHMDGHGTDAGCVVGS